MVTYDEINSNLSWMADRFMLYATRLLLSLLVNVSASESKDNLLTSAVHIVSLYYGSIYRYTKKSLLDVAIEQGQPEAVKCLVDLGEPIDRVNLKGESPLHLAALHGQSAIVEYLLSKGADSNCLTLPITDSADNRAAVDGTIATYNQTPLHLAITTGNESIVQCFIKHSTNQKTSDHQKLDSKLKSNLNIKNSEGLTPLCLAKKLNNQFIGSLLEEHVTNDLDGEQSASSTANKYEGTSPPFSLYPSSPIPCNIVQPFALAKFNYQDKMKRVEEAEEEEEEEEEEGEKEGQKVEEKPSEYLVDGKQDVCPIKKENDHSVVVPPPSKLIQRRDPFSRLLNLHLMMKSDDEIRYDNKLARSPNSPPLGYAGRRKVSFVTEYFEKIESRRESLYRTDSGRWPTPDSSSISDKNGNLFQVGGNNNNKNLNDLETTTTDSINNQQSFEPLTIHEAAANGVVEVIALHLSQRVPVDMIDTDGNTPLHYAARAGQAELVKFLLKKGANLKCKNSEGRNALHVACFSGHEETLRQLILLEGIDLEVKDSEKNTPLIIASSLGHLKLVQLLTFSGAQVNVKNGRKQTPIHKAAFNGFTEVVDHLVVKGGQVNVIDSEKDTPLHLAAHKGHTETVRILLEYGATTEVKNKLKRRPIHEAAYNGSVEVLNLLLARKSKLNSRDKNGDTALNLAAAMGHITVIELLLDKGARINPKKDKSNSAVHMATINEHLETLELLLSRKANVAVRDKKNDTPLHFACSQGNAIIVQTLLNCGSPINVKGSFGRTPLHLSVLNDQTKIIRLLLEKGADKTIKDSDGKTALQYAKLKGYSEAVQELTE